MQNLEVCRCVPHILNQVLDGACVLHVNVERNVIYATKSDSFTAVQISTGKILLSTEVPCLSELISVIPQPENDAVLLATRNGALVLVSEVTADWEEVGEIEGGLVAAASSPEGGLIVCVTSSGSVVLLSSSFTGSNNASKTGTGVLKT